MNSLYLLLTTTCTETQKVPSSGPSMIVKNLTAAWDSNNERDVLKNVSFEVDSVSEIRTYNYIYACLLNRQQCRYTVLVVHYNCEQPANTDSNTCYVCHTSMTDSESIIAIKNCDQCTAIA